MTANPSETHWQHRADEIANAAAQLRATQHALRQIVGEVIDMWKDQVGTHHERCWVRHAPCLALHIQNVVTREEAS